MTQVTVNGGNCGFNSAINVEKLDRTTVRVIVQSDCEHVAAMNPDLSSLEWRQTVFGRMNDSLVYQSASRHLKHAACPVPTAILKAIEVELRLALPKDIIIHFDK
jgi:hypothetical protein